MTKQQKASKPVTNVGAPAAKKAAAPQLTKEEKAAQKAAKAAEAAAKKAAAKQNTTDAPFSLVLVCDDIRTSFPVQCEGEKPNTQEVLAALDAFVEASQSIEAPRYRAKTFVFLMNNKTSAEYKRVFLTPYDIRKLTINKNIRELKAKQISVLS